MYPGYGAPGYPAQQGYQTTTVQQTGYPGGAPGFYPGQQGFQQTTVVQPGYPAQQGFQQTTTRTFVQVPQTYTRVTYQYSDHYSRHMPFMVPYGVDPQTAMLMQQASAIFRQFDHNHSGSLDFKEWKRAMKALNYYMSKHDKHRLFQLVDRDYSGRISEREFVEYWVYSRGMGTQGYGAPSYGAPAYGAPGYGAPVMY